MARYVTQLWEGGGYGTRQDRKSYQYEAYVPDEIAEWEPALPAGALEALTDATSALAILNAGTGGPDLETLAGPLLRAEAVGSSFIEGLRVSHKKLAVATYAPVAAAGTARAVLGNVRAMERALELGTSEEPLTVASLTDIHRILLEGTSEARFAGQVRQEQNWIGGRSSGPAGADFVPPPYEEVQRLLDDLVAFCNRDDLPPIVQAGVAHAQFETIHPFGDGNGRAGRCLIHVVLRRRGATPRYSPPVSVVLAANASAYIAGLSAFRTGDVTEWVGVFSDAVRTASSSAQDLGERLQTLIEELTHRAGPLRVDSVARKVIAGLSGHPIVNADTVADSYHVSNRAARDALNLLEERGVLVKTRVDRQRDREWLNDQIFDLLDEYEYDLAAPTTTEDRRRPSPTRHLRPDSSAEQ